MIQPPAVPSQGPHPENIMMSLVDAAKLVSVLLGAAILGNWFLSELKRSRLRKLPWYSAYLSPPGLLMLAALLVPVIYWLARR